CRRRGCRGSSGCRCSCRGGGGSCGSSRCWRFCCCGGRRCGRCGCSRRCRSWCRCRWWAQTHVVHIHVGPIASVVSVHEELDRNSLPGKGSHVISNLCPGLCIAAHVQDGRQSGCSSRIGDVGILPIESDTVYGSWKVPEAQYSASSRHRDGLVDGAIARGLVTDRTSQESGEGAAVCLRVGNKGCGIGVQNVPWRECP